MAIGVVTPSGSHTARRGSGGVSIEMTGEYVVGDSLIESVITKRSADEMKLKTGDSVTAVVKATEVMISKP